MIILASEGRQPRHEPWSKLLMRGGIQGSYYRVLIHGPLSFNIKSVDHGLHSEPVWQLSKMNDHFIPFRVLLYGRRQSKLIMQYCALLQPSTTRRELQESRQGLLVWAFKEGFKVSSGTVI